MIPVRHIGFTGTRHGMTEEQRKMALGLLEQMGLAWKARFNIILHHGDCVGADADMHDLAQLALCPIKIVIHPPIKDDFRAYCMGNETRIPKSYLARNRDIVDESKILIATPHTFEETSGGTWYTINYAKKVGRQIVIIWPNGETEHTESRKGTELRQHIATEYMKKCKGP